MEETIKEFFEKLKEFLQSENVKEFSCESIHIYIRDPYQSLTVTEIEIKKLRTNKK